MTWPVSPINGQQVEINGILYEYNSTDGVWNRIGFVPTGITLPFLQTPNLTVTNLADLGNIGNVRITGGSANYIIQTDGAGNLTWVAQAAQSAAGNATEIQFNTGGVFTADQNLRFFTGNSTLQTTNVAAVITTASQPYITSVGTLNGVTVSGNTNTGNISVSGNVTSGNANLGNVASANLFTGTLTTAAQPNITSLGILTGLSILGNINGNLLPNANNTFNLGATNQRYNYLYVSANGALINDVALYSNAGNLISNGNIFTTGRFISNLVTGNAPFVVSSNTLVANLNANLLQGHSVSSANTANTIVLRDSNNNFAANTITSNLTGNATTAGTVVTNAQPNITSVGTLTSLSVSGNVTSGNANLGNVATANFFIGSGNNLSNIQAGNITGIVANAFYADSAGNAQNATAATHAATSNTVVDSAQPNITSVGTLTSLSVTGNINSGNATLGNTVTANWFVGNIAGNVTGNINLPGSNTHVLFNNNGVLGATNGFTFNPVSNAVTIAGNISAGNASLGNLVVANFFEGSGNRLSNINGANVSQVANANYATFAGTVSVANTANIANFAARVTINAQPNITSVGTLTNLIVTTSALNSSSPVQFNQTWNNVNQLFTGIRQNITDNNSNLDSLLIDLRVGGISRFSVTKNGTANAANINTTFIAGTLTTTSQPNITSVGNLLSLTVNGNINAPNVYANFFGAFNGNIGANVPNSAIFTNVTVTSTANVTGNLRVGNANLGNLAVANFFSGDGGFISNVSVPANTQIINGNSNVIVQANANVRISANGITQFIVTSTGGNVTGTLSVGGNITAANVSTGNVTTTSALSVAGTANLNVTNFANIATFQQTTDILNQKVNATGTVTHNFQTGAIFYHSSVANNFTVNLTNVPTTANRTIVVPIIIEQGVSAYIANQFQIDGLFQTINWLGNVIPVGTANSVDVVGFTLIRTTSNWTVLGQLTSYGG
jgi:hypothetical protein